MMAGTYSNPRVRRGLRVRIVLLTMVGTMGAVAILGWLSWSTVQALGKQVLEERQQLAVSVAANVDSAVNSELVLLERISPASGASNLSVEQAALREAYVRSRFLTRAFLLNLDGKVVQAEPSTGANMALPPGLPAFQLAVEKGVPEISALSDGTGLPHRLFLLVPLRNAQSRVVGIRVREIARLIHRDHCQGIVVTSLDSGKNAAIIQFDIYRIN